MLKWTALGVLVTCASLLTSLPAVAEGGDDPALSELVEILRAQGVLNNEQYTSVSAKAAERDRAHWTDGIEMWGDFRARYETFYYEESQNFVDSSGNGIFDDRHRFRYRLRLNLKADVSEYADVFVRLTTGRDGRTTNETLGAKLDFNTDEIFLDKAYVRFSPFAEGKLPEQDGSLWFAFGRTGQPWRWDSIFKDWLLWDDELSPAGLYGDYKLRLNERLQLFANGGIYYLDENGNSKNPKLANLQAGFHGAPEDERFDFGGRATWFNLSSLNSSFIDRGIRLGNSGTCTLAPPPSPPNVPGQRPVPSNCTTNGLTGDRNGGSADVLELGAYAKARLIDRWPMLVFVDVSTNLDASKAMVTTPMGSFRTGDDDLAWLIAFQVGDAKEIVRFRMHYAWLEANAFPAQLVDSDLFDGFTNRKGWVWDLTKTVMTNTDASLTMFLSDPIETSGGYANSEPGSDRFRLQANMVWKF